NFSGIARVLVASCRKWRLRMPHPDDARRQEALLYNGDPPAAGNDGRLVFRIPLKMKLSFLNKAAITTDAADEVRPDGSLARPWDLCSVQQVEEAKCIVKVIPVWISGTLWFTVVAELTNYTFLQASTMNLHMGRNFAIPPVSIAAVFYLAVALSVPVYDLLVARAARRVTKTKGGGNGITLLQRQGAGLAVGTLAFMVAAAVERRRRRSALALGDGASSPLPVFLLAPQLAVMGVPGALSMVGQTEFYNTQFPDQMRTLANAAFYCAQGVSSYLATLVVSVVNAATRRRGGPAGWVTDDINAGRIDYFCYAMAVLTAANFVYFLLVCAHFYRYEGEQAADAPAAAGPEPARDGGSTSDSDAALLKT
ncbi:protein NRT1/ PTR FAMILY 2.13, partial [Setaria viridis]|uniref:protein NRT1/ PTR FAMILY 2.13 n=1 Tax=Setaria viridis TaxID=4556 RepID=UPI00149389E3